MAKKLSTEETLARLGKLTKTALTNNDVQDLQKALNSANNLIVAKAAKAAARCGLTDLLPQLTAAFARCMTNPTKTDQGCFAKLAIAEALDILEVPDLEIFRQGLRHIQMEPIYGGQQDTAAALRGKCAFALARCNAPDIFFEILPLLTDVEPQPRLDAVKVLTYLNEEKSELLLRLKVLAGDAQPAVLSECFAGLMSIAPERSLPFVAAFLASADLAILEGAALALGESRSQAAFELLRTTWEETIDRDIRVILLLPMALIRSDEAFCFLLNIVRQGYREYAVAAVKALTVYSDHELHRDQVAQAVAERGDRSISDAYSRTF